jgi:hypothetical protein
VESEQLNASLKSLNPKDARHGDGQYLSDIPPATMTCAQLNVVQGRPGVSVVPGSNPLDISKRIIGWGGELAVWYLKAIWHHDFDDEPVELYSEIGDEGYEIRKVEIYRNGKMDFADESHSTGVTLLSEKPIPDIEEIAAQKEFSPVIVQKAEFEVVWSRAQRS